MKVALASIHKDYPNGDKPVSFRVAALYNSAKEAYESSPNFVGIISYLKFDGKIGDLIASDGNKWTGSWSGEQWGL